MLIVFSFIPQKISSAKVKYIVNVSHIPLLTIVDFLCIQFGSYHLKRCPLKSKRAMFNMQLKHSSVGFRFWRINWLCEFELNYKESHLPQKWLDVENSKPQAGRCCIFLVIKSGPQTISGMGEAEKITNSKDFTR